MSSEARHTPGPWEAQGTSGGWELFAWPDDGQVGDFIGKIWAGERNAEANARLIAAAPELLEVLKAWEQWEGALILEHRENLLESMSTELYDQLLELQVQRNDAIAKAEGRS